MSGGGQTPLLTQRGAAPVNILVFQERPQSMGGRLWLETGQLVLTVDTNSGLVLFKLICVSTTFLSPDFLESVPGQGAAGALKAGAGVQRITVSLLMMRAVGRITDN